MPSVAERDAAPSCAGGKIIRGSARQGVSFKLARVFTTEYAVIGYVNMKWLFVWRDRYIHSANAACLLSQISCGGDNHHQQLLISLRSFRPFILCLTFDSYKRKDSDPIFRERSIFFTKPSWWAPSTWKKQAAFMLWHSRLSRHTYRSVRWRASSEPVSLPSIAERETRNDALRIRESTDFDQDPRVNIQTARCCHRSFVKNDMCQEGDLWIASSLT